jgi:hypothetical protein
MLIVFYTVKIVCISVFMTCSTLYCLCDTYGSMEFMYVCVCVCMYIIITYILRRATPLDFDIAGV